MICLETKNELPASEAPSSSSERSGRDTENRNHLIVAHLPQVKQVAQQIKRRLPDWVSLDELQASGVLGLLAAVDRYEPEHQATLRTFASYKIRSSILDSLRSLDWATRDQRKHARLLEGARAVLEQRYQRRPTEEEIAAELGITITQYHTWRSASHGLTPESLDTGFIEYESNSPGHDPADAVEHWPSHLAERAEQQQRVKEAMESIPERERTILRLYYEEELTLAEIGKLMNLNESRISQLKSRAVQQLRSCLFPQRTPARISLERR